MVRVDRVTGETMSIRPQPATGEPRAALALGHADHPVAARSEGRLHRRATRSSARPIAGCRGSPISPDLTSDANRDDIVTMGVKGSDIRIAKDDGIVAWPTIVSLAESPKTRGPALRGTDDGTLQVSRDAARRGRTCIESCRTRRRAAFVSRDRARRRSTRARSTSTIRRPSAKQLRDLHLRQQRLRPEVDVGERQSEGRGHQDDHRGHEEPGRAVSRRGNGPLRLDRSRRRAGRASKATCPPSASTRSRSTRATTRCCWRRTGARCGFSITSSRSRSTRRRRRQRRREAVHAAAGGDVPAAGARSQLRVLGRPDVLRREPAAGGGDLVVHEAAGQRREAEDHRRGRPTRSARLPADAGQQRQAGMQSACWDLRVQPVPLPAGAGGGGRQGGGGGGAARRSAAGVRAAALPVAAAARLAADAESIRRRLQLGGGGFGGFGDWRRQQPGPVRASAASTTSALVVDGKTIDTKPLRVSTDPEVVLTERRAEEAVRHGDGDAGAAKARHRGRECADAAECQSRRALEPGIR